MTATYYDRLREFENEIITELMNMIIGMGRKTGGNEWTLDLPKDSIKDSCLVYVPEDGNHVNMHIGTLVASENAKWSIRGYGTSDTARRHGCFIVKNDRPGNGIETVIKVADDVSGYWDRIHKQ